MIKTNVVFCDLPLTVKGMTVRTFDGEEIYTIVINSRLSAEIQRLAYFHELSHLEHGDFDVQQSADQVEYVRHMGAVS